MYTISISTPYFEHKADTDVELSNYDAVAAYIRENYWHELIADIIAQYQIEPSGFFENVLEIGDGIYSFVEEEILSAKCAVAICSELDETAREVSACEYSLKELLLEILEERSSDENFSVDTGNIVESSLERFIDTSFWHYGLLDKESGEVIENIALWPRAELSEQNITFLSKGKSLLPILWYGPDNQPPLRRWMLGPDDVASIHFWFDFDNLMENIQGLPEQTFLVWYIYECGRYIPDIDEIRKVCPILLCEDDDQESLTRKITEFFVSKIEACN